jgi:hypothetical protein
MKVVVLIQDANGFQQMGRIVQYSIQLSRLPLHENKGRTESKKKKD